VKFPQKYVDKYIEGDKHMRDRDKKKKSIMETIKIGGITYLKQSFGPRTRKSVFDQETTGKLIDARANRLMVKSERKVYI